jgi:hypothetical protein
MRLHGLAAIGTFLRESRIAQAVIEKGRIVLSKVAKEFVERTLGRRIVRLKRIAARFVCDYRQCAGERACASFRE